MGSGLGQELKRGDLNDLRLNSAKHVLDESSNSAEIRTLASIVVSEAGASVLKGCERGAPRSLLEDSLRLEF